MKVLHPFCLLLLAPGLMLAQAGSQTSDSSRDNLDVAAELKTLREALLQTEKQLVLQQREIEALTERAKIAPAASAGNEQPPSTVQVATYHPIASTEIAAVQPAPQEQEKASQRPLGSFNIGDAVFTPGGFVDLENVFRTTNTQNNIA